MLNKLTALLNRVEQPAQTKQPAPSQPQPEQSAQPLPPEIEQLMRMFQQSCVQGGVHFHFYFLGGQPPGQA